MTKPNQIQRWLIAMALFILCEWVIVYPALAGASQTKLPQGYPQTRRIKIKINQSWKFHLGGPDEAFYHADFDDSGWEEVCVPHTLELTSLALNGYKDDKYQMTFHRDVGWYRRTVRVSDNPDKKIFLEFEGAHQVTDLWVNGKHVGQHAVGGYTPFHFDISKYVRFGAENQVTLMVDNRRRDDCPPDPGPFDYIKFSGLYRDVYLVETDPMHITFNWEALKAGVTITTLSVDPVNLNATINIKTVVRNESDTARNCTVVNRIIDKEGFVVLKLIQTSPIAAGDDYEFNQIGGIEENVRLWSIHDPYLYRVNTLVLEKGQEIDFVETKMGIRKFELDAEEGFRLNGKLIELIGYNRHQHYGYIGDALPNSLHYKDMLQFKEFGFNVVRTAHYPQDDALIEACDELGILVYEEPPTWISIGNDAWFDNYEKAARVMVRNHRNHPSIVIWGAGINHRGYVPRAHYAIKQEDPTRLTASQNSRWTGWQASGLTDIFANMNYGPVDWNRDEPLLAMEGGSGPATVATYKKDPMMPGIISWTAHAYYTFNPNRNPNDRTRGGSMSVFRYPGSRLFWYQSEMKEDPIVKIVREWKQGMGDLIIYSNCEEIELFVNKKSIGTFKPSTDPRYSGLDHPPFVIPVQAFEAGELLAQGKTNGKVMASQTVHTPGIAAAIKLVMDTTGRCFKAGGSDILVGYAMIVDKNGTHITDTSHRVHFTVKGDAFVVGDGADIDANPALAKNGVAPVLIRSGKTAGKVTIIANSEGLKSGSTVVETIPDQADMILANALPIYDMEKVKVDMGATGQLIQFDWIPWNSEDNQPSTLNLDAFGGIEASVKTVTGRGVIRWLGEMNVIGKFGFVYGEGVLGFDDEGLALEFKGLPSGKYQIKTYHHFVPVSKTDSMDPNREKLKTQNINKLPYAKSIHIKVIDANGEGAVKTANTTQGNNIQNRNPATFTTQFESDGKKSVSLIMKDARENKGVWLNGFELSERP